MKNSDKNREGKKKVDNTANLIPFKSGVCGNPKGRPKNLANSKQMRRWFLEEAQRLHIEFDENGQPIEMSKLQAVVKRVFDYALDDSLSPRQAFAFMELALTQAIGKAKQQVNLSLDDDESEDEKLKKILEIREEIRNGGANFIVDKKQGEYVGDLDANVIDVEATTPVSAPDDYIPSEEHVDFLPETNDEEKEIISDFFET